MPCLHLHEFKVGADAKAVPRPFGFVTREGHPRGLESLEVQLWTRSGQRQRRSVDGWKSAPLAWQPKGGSLPVASSCIMSQGLL